MNGDDIGSINYSGLSPFLQVSVSLRGVLSLCVRVFLSFSLGECFCMSWKGVINVVFLLLSMSLPAAISSEYHRSLERAQSKESKPATYLRDAILASWNKHGRRNNYKMKGLASPGSKSSTPGIP